MMTCRSRQWTARRTFVVGVVVVCLGFLIEGGLCARHSGRWSRASSSLSGVVLPPPHHFLSPLLEEGAIEVVAGSSSSSSDSSSSSSSSRGGEGGESQEEGRRRGGSLDEEREEEEKGEEYSFIQHDGRTTVLGGGRRRHDDCGAANEEAALFVVRVSGSMSPTRRAHIETLLGGRLGAYIGASSFVLRGEPGTEERARALLASRTKELQDLRQRKQGKVTGTPSSPSSSSSSLSPTLSPGELLLKFVERTKGEANSQVGRSTATPEEVAALWADEAAPLSSDLPFTSVKPLTPPAKVVDSLLDSLFARGEGVLAGHEALSLSVHLFEGQKEAFACQMEEWTRTHAPFMNLTLSSKRETASLTFNQTASARGMAVFHATASALAHLNTVIRVDVQVRSLPLEQLNFREVWATSSAQFNYTPLKDGGLDGTGEIVGVADTGLDVDSCYFYDPNVEAPFGDSSETHRKIQSVFSAEGTFQSPRFGHGTHVATTVLGSALDESNARAVKQNGVASGARLVFMDMFDPEANSFVLPSGPTDVAFGFFDWQLLNDVGVSVNAWGRTPLGYLPSSDVALDTYMEEHPEFLAVFAIGNTGSVSAEKFSVYWPATSKNVLAVGASVTADPTTAPLDSSGYVAWFNSRGPTYDGRFKPDLYGPGYNVLSEDAEEGGSPGCSQTNLVYKSGTSMATGVVGGLAAVVRQYFRMGYYPSGIQQSFDAFVPSAALIKAVLIGAAVPMNGFFYADESVVRDIEQSTPNFLQGFGSTVLGPSLPLFPKATELFVINDQVIEVSDNPASDFVQTCFTVTGPKALSITLAWTDPPNLNARAISQLVNDLDLAVASSTRAFYVGNDLESDSSQGIFNIFDPLNNVERVLIPSPTVGSTIVVSVIPSFMGTSSQKFSLAVAGQFTTVNCGSPDAACRYITCAVGYCVGGKCRCTSLGSDDALYGGTNCTHSPQSIRYSDTTGDEPYIFKNNLLGTHSWVYFALPLYQGQGDLVVEMRRTSYVGDPDLYVTFGELPTINGAEYYDTNCDTCGTVYSQVVVPADAIETSGALYLYIGVYGYCCDQSTFDLVVHGGYPGILNAAPVLSPSTLLCLVWGLAVLFL